MTSIASRSNAHHSRFDPRRTGSHGGVDEVRQFWIGVGGVLESASLADSSVRVSLVDGRTVEGIPDRPPSDVPQEDQIEETGMPRTVGVDGAPVELEDVAEIVLVRPLQAPDTVPPGLRGAAGRDHPER